MKKGVIREIAKREGISEKEVREEMEKAIKYAYFRRNRNQRWNALLEMDQLPSPEEFIAAVLREGIAGGSYKFEGKRE